MLKLLGSKTNETKWNDIQSYKERLKECFRREKRVIVGVVMAELLPRMGKSGSILRMLSYDYGMRGRCFASRVTLTHE